MTKDGHYQFRKDRAGVSRVPKNQSENPFRRSATLTGSVSNSVVASNEKKSQLKSPRLHEQTLRKHRRKLGAYLFLILVICAGLLYIVINYTATISDVRAIASQSNADIGDANQYTTLVQSYYSERPFERFDFMFDQVSFSQFMARERSDIAGARLESSGKLWTSDLAITFREPVVSWTIQQNQYFVDASGKAFTVNHFSAPSVDVRDNSGISAETGVVASTGLLRYISRMIVLINGTGLGQVSTVDLPAGLARQVDIRLEGRQYYYKINVDRDPAGQVRDIQNITRYLESSGLQPEYVDVRVSSRAYYR